MTKIERTFTIHRPMEEVFTYLSEVEHGPRYISGQREVLQMAEAPASSRCLSMSGKPRMATTLR